MKSSHKQLWSRKNSGFVLITSILMLVTLSAVAVALVGNSATDAKIANAFETKERALNIALGANDETFVTASTSNTALFTSQSPSSYNNAIHSDGFDNTTVTMNWDTENTGATACQPLTASQASSSNTGLKCNRLRIRSQTKYGKTKKNEVAVTSGAVQYLIQLGG